MTSNETAAARSTEATDEILKHVIAGRRGVALLLIYRSQQGSLEEAWHMMNDLSENSNFELPEHDLSFTNVQNYLTQSTSGRDRKYFALAAIFFLIVGGAIVVYKWPPLRTGIASFFWSETTASITNVRFTEKSWVSHTGSRRTRTTMHYAYQYETESEVHEGFSRRTYLEGWDTEFEPGDKIRILYDPNKPSRSLHDRKLYSRSLGVGIGFIVMLPGLIIVFFYVMFRSIDRTLRKFDPTPVESE